MEAYQERVVEERNDLGIRIAKLRAFLSGPGTLTLPHDEHERLWLQFGLMVGLERVLTERIAAWAVASHVPHVPDVLLGRKSIRFA